MSMGMMMSLSLGQSGNAGGGAAPWVGPALTTAKFDGDSRTASSGGRSVSGGAMNISGSSMGGYNMAALIQPLCDNKFLQRTGFLHAIGGSTTLAQEERSKSLSIAATGNPAFATTGAAADAAYSSASDGIASILTQAGNHVFSASVGVNDIVAYFNTPHTASVTLEVIARIADAIGAAGKAWYIGNEFPRGDTAYTMESHAVSGGTCTATNTTNFQDGESYGSVGVVGVFASGDPRPLTKVASAPGQDQYTVTGGGLYTFGGTAPTTVYITYNASPPGGRGATYDQLRIIREWVGSESANFVSTINSVDYGLPGLRYGRPWVRVADTFNALLDVSSGAMQTVKPGMSDSLQLHGTILASYATAQAFKTKLEADYPEAVSLAPPTERNNWYAARGVNSGTTYSGTLPPSMRTAFTGTPAPTLVAIDGVPKGSVNTSTGAITGTNIVSGTLNFATGAWTITFDLASRMPLNSQLWFEQDIGNYDTATMTEGTIGRSLLLNGLLDMTAATGSYLVTTTGTSNISTVASASVPYGWTLFNTAMQTAITNGTATVAAAAETDSRGFPRFVVEASGKHTAATALNLQQGAPHQPARITGGDNVLAGAMMRYAKHSTIGRTYGHTGAQFQMTQSSSSYSVPSSTGPQNITSMATRCVDGGSGMYIDDALLDAAGGAFEAHRVPPLLDTTGATIVAGGITSFIINTAANVPFAYRLGIGRVQARRRNDVA